MESKSYTKLANVTQKKRSKLTDREKKLVVTGREREESRGNIGTGNQKVQTVRYKISYKDVPYNMGNITNI